MPVELERDNHVATITLNRPDARNALNLEMLNELARAWAELATDDDIRVVILTGAGDRAFSAGADLKDIADAELTAHGPIHDAFYPDLMGLHKPVIAAINGFAVAGGLELVGATDIRIAAANACFSLAEAKVGLFAAGGSVVRLTRQLPWAFAMEVILTGRLFDAEEAYRWGLVNKVVPPGDALKEARVLADEITSLAPVALAAMKRCALQSSGVPLAQAFEDQKPLIEQVLATADAKEGPRAFVEKRKPQFHGN